MHFLNIADSPNYESMSIIMAQTSLSRAKQTRKKYRYPACILAGKVYRESKETTTLWDGEWLNIIKMDKYIKDPSGKTLGIIKTQGGKEVAYDAGNRNLGSYSNGKTYAPGGAIISSGNTLASLITNKK